MIKPSVVFIKGVHSTTGHDTDSDIGFPQLELEKLFEGATIKVTNDETYNSSKKYIFYDSLNNPIAIQDAGHFNCIKNGYYSIASGINHYYTKSGNNYNYNAVPDVSTWAGKYSFSNTIKNKGLYSISPETDRICVGGNYYKKNGNNYIKQTQETYTLYEDISIDWGDNYKYERHLIIARDEDNNILRDENNNIIRMNVWQNNGGFLATSGYYLSIFTIENETQYKIELLNIVFNDNGTTETDNLDGAILYKLDINNSTNLYIKNGNSLNELIVNNGGITFNFDPVANIEYIYHKFSNYSYPNTEESEPASLYTDSGSLVYRDFNINNFPIYTTATITEISKTSHVSYAIYEKTAVKINYNYSGDANSLKFIFTDKDINGVLEACNLPNDIKKYVHLTNLRYNEN